MCYLADYIFIQIVSGITHRSIKCQRVASQRSLKPLQSFYHQNLAISTMLHKTHSSLSHIATGIDRIQQLLIKQDHLHQELQQALRMSSHSSEESSVCEKERPNSTLCVRPVDSRSETVPTIYRSAHQEDSQDQVEGQDDKSTVILAAIHQLESDSPSRSAIHCKSKLQGAQLRHLTQPDAHPVPKGNCKNDIFIDNRSNQQQSRSPCLPLKTAISKPKFKLGIIEGSELKRLQMKKSEKKTELSSNRRKTQRSAANGSKGTLGRVDQRNIHQILTKVYCKQNSAKGSVNKRTEGRRTEVRYAGEWGRSGEESKKLSRVNIGKLQENIKRTQEGKSQPLKNLKKIKQDMIPTKKLHFTEQNDGNLDETTEIHIRHTRRYLQQAQIMTQAYFEQLAHQIKGHSPEITYKTTLIAILLNFLGQLKNSPAQTQRDSNEEDWRGVDSDSIRKRLVKPRKIMDLLVNFPTNLLKQGCIDNSRKVNLQSQFKSIDLELDDCLQLFLIKKTPLFTTIYCIIDYVNFLLANSLIKQSFPQPEDISGFYSSRKNCLSRQPLRDSKAKCDSKRRVVLQQPYWTKAV